MRTATPWLVAVSVLVTLTAGCASDDGSHGGTERTERHDSDRQSDDCSGRIDEQITAGEIPNADRDYFIGMCQANP